MLSAQAIERVRQLTTDLRSFRRQEAAHSEDAGAGVCLITKPAKRSRTPRFPLRHGIGDGPSKGAEILGKCFSRVVESALKSTREHVQREANKHGVIRPKAPPPDLEL